MRTEYTRAIRCGVIAFAAVALMAIGASTAFAYRHFTWAVAGKVLPAGVEKAFGVGSSSNDLTFKTEVAGKPVTIECGDVGLEHGLIYDGLVKRKLAGAGHEAFVLTGCKMGQEWGRVCEMSESTAHSVRLPPTSEYAKSVLVESGVAEDGHPVDDILPEAGGVFAELSFQNSPGERCPFAGKWAVKSMLTVGQPGESKEGEGGLVATVSAEGGSVEKKLEFPSSTSELANDENAHGNAVKADQLGLYINSEYIGPIEIYGQVHTELSSLEEWSIQEESSAVPPHVWTVAGKTLAAGSEEKIEAKLKSGTEAILHGELGKKPFEVTCKALNIANGAFLNGSEGKVGWTNGTTVLGECKLGGELGKVCKLTSASAKEIKLPPTATGAGVLAEGGTEAGEPPALLDLMPEEKGTLAVIGIKKEGLCAYSQDEIDTALSVGAQGKSNEGEGGVAATISGENEEATTHTFVFPKTAYTKAWTWNATAINIGSFRNNAEATSAGFSAEIEVKLTSGKKWGVK